MKLLDRSLKANWVDPTKLQSYQGISRISEICHKGKSWFGHKGPQNTLLPPQKPPIFSTSLIGKSDESAPGPSENPLSPQSSTDKRPTAQNRQNFSQNRCHFFTRFVAKICSALGSRHLSTPPSPTPGQPILENPCYDWVSYLARNGQGGFSSLIYRPLFLYIFFYFKTYRLGI